MWICVGRVDSKFRLRKMSPNKKIFNGSLEREDDRDYDYWFGYSLAALTKLCAIFIRIAIGNDTFSRRHDFTVIRRDFFISLNFLTFF